jgi:hypothetical protein
MRAYSEALDQQLQTVLANTITEDTLRQEMEVAALAQRDRIRVMTAVPPLLMDEDMLQLQTRCATLELQSEDLTMRLRAQLQAHKENDSVKELARLHKSMKRIQKELEDQTDAVELLTLENTRLLQDNSLLQLKATKVDTEVRQMKRAHQLDEKEHEVNQKAIRGLKERVDTAEGELERLKRKRKESVSPDRVVTGILKRPGTSPPSAQRPTKTDTSPASAQPSPKKSRSRKNRFGEQAAELSQPGGPGNSTGAPLTSSNQDGGNDGVKEKKGQFALAKRRVFDPVLTNPPSSVRRKNDIINEIEESAKTFSLTGKDTSFVFHRSNVDHQVVVTKKALAYVETLITTTCVHLLKGAKVEGNPVQAYLGTLSLSRIKELQKEVDAALEQCEDSSKHMAVYKGGEDLAQRIRAQSFSREGNHALRPHKATDSLHRLHEREEKCRASKMSERALSWSAGEPAMMKKKSSKNPLTIAGSCCWGVNPAARLADIHSSVVGSVIVGSQWVCSLLCMNSTTSEVTARWKMMPARLPPHIILVSSNQPPRIIPFTGKRQKICCCHRSALRACSWR